MIFTEEQLLELEKLSVKHECVKILLEDYRRLTKDSSAELQSEWNEIGSLMAADLRSIREDKNFKKCVLITNTGEDKGLEKLLKLGDKLEMIISVMKGGGSQEKGSNGNGKKGLPEF